MSKHFAISSSSSGTATTNTAMQLSIPSNIANFVHVEQSSPYSPWSLSPSHNGATRLISHYFHFVCNINSCSDSPDDSLRTVTRGLMSSSRLIYFCVLSMSAAHLYHIDPQWSRESLVYLTQAISTLRVQLKDVLDKASRRSSVEHNLDQALIGIILLGTSTSWHNASELGLEHIIGSRILLQEYVCPRLYQCSTQNRRKLSFFIGLQTYWETVASFLLDQDLDQLDYLYKACIELSSDPIYVHPWTGISSTVWVLLAKAGCVARRRLRLLADSSCYEQSDLTTQMDQLVLGAKTIEAQLLSYEIPQASNVNTNSTEHASIPDLERIAWCCKFAALLELYQAFGSIWDTQPALEILSTEWQFLKRSLDLGESQDSIFYTNIYGFLSHGVLRLLRCISPDSSTRCLQPFLLLIAGSVLVADGGVDDHSHTTTLLPEVTYAKGANPQDPNLIKLTGSLCVTLSKPQVGGTWLNDSLSVSLGPISTWRDFVYQRITCIEQAIKLDSLRRIRTILLEVWACNDAIQSTEPRPADNNLGKRVHWINIMEEKKLHFLF